jgi:hypothetical protein
MNTGRLGDQIRRAQNDESRNTDDRALTGDMRSGDRSARARLSVAPAPCTCTGRAVSFRIPRLPTGPPECSTSLPCGGRPGPIPRACPWLASVRGPAIPEEREDECGQAQAFEPEPLTPRLVADTAGDEKHKRDEEDEGLPAGAERIDCEQQRGLPSTDSPLHVRVAAHRVSGIDCRCSRGSVGHALFSADDPCGPGGDSVGFDSWEGVRFELVNEGVT